MFAKAGSHQVIRGGDWLRSGALGVESPTRSKWVLQDHKNVRIVVNHEQLLLVQKEQSHSDADQDLWSFVEQNIPNSQCCFQRQRVDIQAEQPIVNHCFQVDFPVLQVAPHPWKFLLKHPVQYPLLRANPQHCGLVECFWQQMLHQGTENPERRFLVKVQQQHASDKIHGLAIADRRVARRKSDQQASHLLDRLTLLDLRVRGGALDVFVYVCQCALGNQRRTEANVLVRR
mmetsp:Transcript_35243/g.80734  ORF Transcript_35243/g.80734 Transcript_35243/m.80734 type:complete len:231 (-) Transcript_35243:283-975(-)